MDDNLYFETSQANNLDAMINEPDETIATPSNVKLNYLFRDPNTTEVLTGTMPKIPAETIKINPASDYHSDNSYTIPEGYHDGTGKVIVGDLSEYTVGNATPEQVANNKVFWVNGKRLIGTLDLDENDQVGTATGNDLLLGKTAWVNRQKITGTIPVLARQDKTLLAGESYIHPYGLAPGTAVISAATLASQTQGTAEANDIASGEIAWVNGQKVTGTFVLRDAIAEYMASTNTLKSQVLDGKYFYSSNYGVVTTGTMPNHTGEGILELQNGQTYKIPEGYYDGNSGVHINALSDVTAATAQAKNILSGKTAWVNGVKITGTMTDNGSPTTQISAGETYTIPLGYHTGLGKVVAKPLSEETYGTATAAEIVNNKVAWVNGQRLVGSMPSNPANSVELEHGSIYHIPAGYHTGAGSVWSKDLADSTPGTASTDEILDGETAWVRGVQLTGSMPNNAPETVTLNAGASYPIALGYHNGTGLVKAETLANQTQSTADPDDLVEGETAWVNGQKITGTLKLTGTATAGDVLNGLTFYNTDLKHSVTGSLTLSGTATEDDVLAGATFYSTQAKRKLTGNLGLYGNAAINHVLVGEKFYTTDPKTIQIGTMPNNGALNRTLDAGESVSVPEGYHNGNGIVSAKPLDVQTAGTATAGDLLNEKTAWVNGSKITGNLSLTGNATADKVLTGYTFYNTNAKQKIEGSVPINPSAANTVGAGEVYTIPYGYHDGTGTITGTGLGPQTIGTATASDIVLGKTAWVNGVKITGIIEPKDPVVRYSVPAGQTVDIPAGFYSANSIVTTLDLASQTAGNALDSQIVAGKVAWVNGVEITGTMTDQGDWSRSNVLAGSVINIPEGYHSGNGSVTVETLANQTPGDAVDENIFTGKKAWVAGRQITGNMPNNANWSQNNILAGSSYTIPKGYHDGTGTIIAETLANQTVADAINHELLINKTAWVNGVKITGDMPDETGWHLTNIPAGSSYTIPKGYHDGTKSVTAATLASQTVGDAVAENIINNKVAWVNGVQVTGNMPVFTDSSVTLLAGDSYDIGLGYHDGNGHIQAETLAAQTPGSATSGSLLSPNTAWVNGEQITGTIDTYQVSQVRITVGNSLTLAAGYYPNGVIIYTLYDDRLDLTGTDAYWLNESLYPESAGYVDAGTESLIITAETL